MGKTRPYRLAAAITALGVVASLFVAASPAQAYRRDPLVYEAVVDTSPGAHCPSRGGPPGISFVRRPDGCFHDDEVDYTLFKFDPGGRAIELILRDDYATNRGKMLGKVEFHPYGEHFWVYDTMDDGDGFYYMLTVHYSVGDTNFGPYSAGGGAGVDVRDINLSIAEGVPVTVRVYDGSGRRDLVATSGGGRT